MHQGPIVFFKRVNRQMKIVWFSVLFFFLFYVMISLGFSRYHSHIASIRINKMEYDQASIELQKALSLIPLKASFNLFNSDLQRIYYLLGKTFLFKAKNFEGGNTSSSYLRTLEKAREYYLLAAGFNPDDIQPAKGLAESTGLLEKASDDLFPEKENPYNALPLYRSLAELRPNGLTVHYMIARYLHYKGKDRELSNTIKHIAAIFPGDAVNGDLRAEAFYSPELREPVKKGVQKAIAKGVHQRQAYFAMAKLMEEENEDAQAIEFYLKGMIFRKSKNNENIYIHLGRLFSKLKKNKQAFEAFEKGLYLSTDFERSLKQIYHIFKKQGAYQDFLDFSTQIEEKKGSSRIVNLFIARARMALGFNELARARLLGMVSEKPDSEAFYLLAVIAETQGDWDTMELNIQKATVLEPDKCHYYSKFAKALYKQGKNIQAKIQQIRAGQCSEKKKK